jgi:hypothetical protein
LFYHEHFHPAPRSDTSTRSSASFAKKLSKPMQIAEAYSDAQLVR